MIERLLEDRAAPPPWLKVDAGDDCAVVVPGVAAQALTVDTLVEGVHFDAALSPADVGYKAVAVSVSDVAACGARPTWMLVALSLPAADPEPWVEQFAVGLRQACREFGVYLAGGDVTRAPVRFVSTTLSGQCVAEPLVRSGGRPGDVLWVTGTPGLAGAGWSLDDPPPQALAALRRPRPRLELALDLARAGLCTAAMDLSDGLAADLPRLAQSSGVAAIVDPARLPVPDALRGHPRLRDCQLAGGDDYELLFTAAPAAEARVRALAERHGVRVTPVGRLEAGRGAWASDGPWPRGFAHFQGAP